MIYIGKEFDIIEARTNTELKDSVKKNLAHHEYNDDDLDDVSMAFVDLVGMGYTCNDTTLKMAECALKIAKIGEMRE